MQYVAATYAKNKAEEKEESRKSKDYYDIGNYIRHTVCHGYPTVYRKSTKELDYNEDINKNYLSDIKNIDSRYRRKKDWLGKWTEQTFITAEIQKKLSIANSERLKTKSESKVN